jgi:ribosomal protein S28E/S33
MSVLLLPNSFGSPVAVKPGIGWGVGRERKKLLNSFERKILRRILGPVSENEMLRIRYSEHHREYNGLDLVLCIKFKRLQLAGHVQRLPLNHILKKAVNFEFTGSLPVG